MPNSWDIPQKCIVLVCFISKRPAWSGPSQDIRTTVSGCLLTRLDQVPVDQAFRNLHGVQRRALAKVVGNTPERQAFSTVMSSRMREI